MKLAWNGEPCHHPATGLDVMPGERDYPDEHADALLALGLTKPAEPFAPAKRKATKGGEEDIVNG